MGDHRRKNYPLLPRDLKENGQATRLRTSTTRVEGSFMHGGRPHMNYQKTH